jgi:hypothetical protein
MAVDLFDPSYGVQGEILATSNHPWWLLYTSHEGTTALTEKRGESWSMAVTDGPRKSGSDLH